MYNTDTNKSQISTLISFPSYSIYIDDWDWEYYNNLLAVAEDLTKTQRKLVGTMDFDIRTNKFTYYLTSIDTENSQD